MSNAPKFTPGPWKINPSGRSPIIGIDVEDGGDLLPLVEVVHGFDKRVATANARLIAAAPELYEALCDLIAVQGYTIEEREPAIGRARAALEKAAP